MVSATLMIHMNEITNAAVEREAMIIYESNLDMSTTGNVFFSLTYSGWTVPAIGVARKSKKRRHFLRSSCHLLIDDNIQLLLVVVVIIIIYLLFIIHQS